MDDGWTKLVKQLFQSLKNGNSEIAEVPAPRVNRGQLLIGTTATLVSAGTERMLVEFGQANLLQKARQQPDKVKMVLEKVRTDGLFATLDAVRSKLDQPMALGYCNVGRVIEAATPGYAVGERVVSNGKHAEFVTVPMNLCAKVPDSVSDDSAAFTVLAAIGLQGIRLVRPTLGECVVVTGLGLVGLLTVQLLRAQGCRVLGIDFDAQRLALARSFGAETVNPATCEDVLSRAAAFSRGRGVDAVIITASTKSSEPMSQAAKMCRQRGRVVLVGVAGLELSRADFYEKEISFQVSCSYGPGRYDSAYEEDGLDYPIGFVRWTEQRNFEAVLDMMATGAIDPAALITHRFAIEEGEKAMALLASSEPALGILLHYGQSTDAEPLERRVTIGAGVAQRVQRGRAVLGILGTGNYAGRTLIPAFKAAGAELHSAVSAGGVSAVHFGRKFGFKQAATDESLVLADDAIDSIVVATRHDVHARQVLAALRAGKNVFCEKPLCLTLAELDEIETEARARPDQLLTVGFNRRFAPLAVKMRALLAPLDAPTAFIVTVNAGEIPSDHWTQDAATGGGRIIGEACHFIDLLRYLADSPIVDFTAQALGKHPGVAVRDDKAVITLMFEDGSIGTIHYLANGHRAFPKERVEVFASGRVLQLDNFRRLKGWGWPGFSKMSLWRQNKGQVECATAFVDALCNETPHPIPLDQIIESSRLSIQIGENLR